MHTARMFNKKMVRIIIKKLLSPHNSASDYVFINLLLTFHMRVREHIQKLCEQHYPEMQHSVWMNEKERFSEFVFCLLYAHIRKDPQNVRRAIESLQNLNLLDVDKLELAGKPDSKESALIAYILEQHGFDSQSTKTVLLALAGIAGILKNDYYGKIQIMLRNYGEEIRDKIVQRLSESGIPASENLRFAVTHWLQNVCFMPLSLKHDALKRFCETNNVKPEEVWQAADELDLNLSLVDDLLELEKPPVKEQQIS
jgi:hypothetical protein